MARPERFTGDGSVRFGLFEFNARSLELWKNGRPVSLRPQALKLLALLVAQPGEVVLREDIQRALWSDDTFVDFEQGVNHAVRELRASLGDAAESPRFIQTLPRRGYRFLATVQPAAPAAVVTESVPPLPKTPGEQAADVDSPDGSLGLPPVPPIVEGESSTSAARLSGWALAALSLLVVAIVIGVSLTWRATEAGEGGVPSRPLVLAVRQFVTPAGDTITGVGLAHAIAARLAGLSNVRVHADDVGGQTAVGEAGATPTHVLSGEVKRHGQDVAVVAEFRTAEDTLWVESFRVQSEQLFDVESVIAERVVDTLRLRLAAGQQERLRRRYTSDAKAYQDYLRGRAALVAYTPDGARRAVQAFEAALSRDPSYALASAGLAMAAADMYLRFAPPPDVESWGARAERHAREALERDADLAEAHLARAAVARKREFDWNTTIEASRRALVLNPSLDQAHLFSAAAYYHLGFMNEARIALDKGRRLHGPDVVEPLRIEALIALFSGDFAPARARLEEVSQRSSQAIGDTYLALAYYYSGSAERGRTMLETLSGASSASTAARAGVALAGVLAAQGDTAGARARLDRVSQLAYRDHHVAYGFGAAYAQLGEMENAAHWLRIAADTGFPCLPFFERDPLLDPLRSRPEFAQLLSLVRARREAALSTPNP